jgi:hypothetical protein
MPSYPTHPSITLEPKKKGWYCEECEQNVLTYDDVPRPGDAAAPASTTPAAAPVTPASTTLDLDALAFPVAHPLAFALDPALGTDDARTIHCSLPTRRCARQAS